MLFERLSQLTDTTSRGQCRIAAILPSLSAQDGKALIAALKNRNVSQRAICDALREEGITASRDAVRHARACLSNISTCHCNISNIVDGGK